VSSNGHLTTYIIGGPATLESASTQVARERDFGVNLMTPNMVWDDEILVSAATTDDTPDSSSSTVAGGPIVTRRLLVGDQLCLVMQNKTSTCKRFFKLVPPTEQNEQMKDYARLVYTAGTSEE